MKKIVSAFLALLLICCMIPPALSADQSTQAADVLYELGLFVTGLSQGLTYWGRLHSYLLTSIYTSLIMIPLYSLVCKTGLIGGNTWKE